MTLKKITDLKIKTEKETIFKMGKRSKQGIYFLYELFMKPVITIKDVQSRTNLSPKAANGLVRAFIVNKILKETTGNRRNRIFIFEEYLKMFK